MRRKVSIPIIAMAVVLCVVALIVLNQFNLLPRRTYTAEDFDIQTVLSGADFNENGVDDYTDILLGARADAKNHPTYNGAYMDLNRRTAGILVALFTGLRIGELCGIQMKDISLIDKTITVNKTVQRIYDKKKGTTYINVGPPKTKTSARTIPIPSLLMNIVKKFYTENPNHFFLTGKAKPTEPRTYRQFFSRFLKRNGLQQVKFHEIRHTFAVRAIEIPEFDIKSLPEILGHKNVSFTLNVYGSANLQQKVKCMNLLNDLL